MLYCVWNWYKFGKSVWCFILLFCSVFVVILCVLSAVWSSYLGWRLVYLSGGADLTVGYFGFKTGEAGGLLGHSFWWKWIDTYMSLDALLPAMPSIGHIVLTKHWPLRFPFATDHPNLVLPPPKRPWLWLITPTWFRCPLTTLIDVKCFLVLGWRAAIFWCCPADRQSKSRNQWREAVINLYQLR